MEVHFEPNADHMIVYAVRRPEEYKILVVGKRSLRESKSMADIRPGWHGTSYNESCTCDDIPRRWCNTFSS